MLGYRLSGFIFDRGVSGRDFYLNGWILWLHVIQLIKGVTPPQWEPPENEALGLMEEILPHLR